MKMSMARRDGAAGSAAERMHLVLRDFLKLVTAAVLCGLAVSFAAAGVALLLSSTAEARSGSVGETGDRDAVPGVLVVGAGCDGIELAAMERDWYVRIAAKTIEVRVMQTWVLPNDTEGVAVFQVRLPRGGRLMALSAQTPTGDWAGQKIRADTYARMSPATYLDLTRRKLLVRFSPDGEITTSPLTGLSANDIVVVQYTYLVRIDSTTPPDRLELPLEPANATGPVSLPQADADDPAAPMRAAGVKASVWVEWDDRKPTRMLRMPHDASLEHDASPARAVAGLSWTAVALKPGEKFRLAWRI